MIQLKKITYDNVDAVTALEVEEEQKRFVATNTASLVDAYVAISNGLIKDIRIKGMERLLCRKQYIIYKQSLVAKQSIAGHPMSLKIVWQKICTGNLAL